MSLGTIIPTPWFTGLDDDGTPLASGKLYTYYAGTDTPFTMCTDIGLTIPAANPTILDSAGRCSLYTPEGTVKYVLKRANGTTVRTQDNVPSTSVGQSGGLGEVFSFGGNPSSPVTAAAYLSGATFDKLHPGTAVLTLDAATLSGTYKLRATGVVDSAVTLTVAIVNLSDGAPDTPLATLTITSTTGAIGTSGAITFPAGGVDKNYGIKCKISGGSGEAWGISLIRTA